VEIQISTRHGHVSDDTREWIAEKVERLPRLYDRIHSIEVTVDLEHRDTPSVDLRVLAKQNEFVAASRSEGLAAAVDSVIEKMEQQLRRHKEKVQDRHRSPGPREAGGPS
jgi:putative sigma-54 modulation protein